MACLCHFHPGGTTRFPPRGKLSRLALCEAQRPAKQKPQPKLELDEGYMGAKTERRHRRSLHPTAARPINME